MFWCNETPDGMDDLSIAGVLRFAQDDPSLCDLLIGTSLCPCLPRSLARGPQLLQMVLVAQRVHRLPEAAMMKGAQFARVRKSRQRILLERSGVARDVFAHFGRKHKESAVDPLSVACGLFLEIDDCRLLHHQRAPASGRLHGGQRCQLAMLLVELDRA